MPHQSVLYPGSLQAMLNRLGLWNQCVLCLDFADDRCYCGTGQFINDLRFGLRFKRGANETATTDDPTFVGTAGCFTPASSLADITIPHFSFDGGDWFNGELIASWMPWTQWARTGSKRTYFSVLRITAGTNQPTIICNRGAADFSAQSSMLFDATEHLQQIMDGGDSAFVTITSSNTIVTNSWSFCLVSGDEIGGATGSFNQLNSTVTTGNMAITPDAAINGEMNIGGFSAGGTPQAANFINATGRIMMLAAFDRNLCTEESAALRRECVAWRVPALV